MKRERKKKTHDARAHTHRTRIMSGGGQYFIIYVMEGSGWRRHRHWWLVAHKAGQARPHIIIIIHRYYIHTYTHALVPTYRRECSNRAGARKSVAWRSTCAARCPPASTAGAGARSGSSAVGKYTSASVRVSDDGQSHARPSHDGRRRAGADAAGTTTSRS